MVGYLVLLEIRDEEIASLIGTLREVFMGKRSRTPVHVTVRGPYTSPIEASKLERWMAQIRDDVLLISGAGRFTTAGEYVVYLKVSATNATANLNRITKKHDFPKARFGFNPHVTVYAGPDRRTADKAYAFLRREQLELLCRDFGLGVHAVSPQYEMFPIVADKAEGGYAGLVARGTVREGIVDRARHFLDESGLPPASAKTLSPVRTRGHRRLARQGDGGSRLGALSARHIKRARRQASKNRK